jgi:hypothetical protein
MQGIVIWGVSALVAALIAATFAAAKNRDISYWVAWCFLAPPLVIVLMLLPKRAGPRPRQPSLDQVDRDTGML